MKLHQSLPAFIVLLLSCLFVVGKAVAQEQNYFIEIAVSEQSASEYKTAVRLGLSAVIERVAGNRAVLNRPDVQAALSDASNYVDQYQYQNLDNPVEVLRVEKTPSVSKTGAAPYLLRLQFSSDAIAELLDEEVQPASTQANVEGSTMFWLVMESQGRSELVGGDVQPMVQIRVEELAASVGITPVFPVLDLQDYQALSVTDIRGAFDERVLAASERYGTDAIVTGFITESDNGIWTTNWRRYSSGSAKTFANNALNLDSVLNGGIEWVAQTAKIYANETSTPALTSSSAASVWFSRIDTTQQYTQVLKLLESLPGVESVTASYLSTTGMMFSITPRLSSMQIQQNLSNARWLRQTAPPEVLDSGPSIPEGAELFYEYAG